MLYYTEFVIDMSARLFVWASPCVRVHAACQCNNHSNTCANATYCSACEHNTEGNQCQTCVAGYYGNAMLGRPGDCQQCDCNNWSSTCVPAGSSFQCDACTGNTTGDSCELCRPNFYGNPTQRVACRSCLEKCNNNSISCDSRTGECSVCEGNTDGTSCERCADNFFGNAKNASCIGKTRAFTMKFPFAVHSPF